jgi:RNA polymerase sigma-70 factor (sigma-E family)
MRGLRPDEAEFTALVAGKAHALRRTAYLMCGDWHQAEDLVQTSFIKLYKVWNRVQDRQGLDGYLRTTLLRACIDAKKRTGRERPSAELPDAAGRDDRPSGDREVLVAALRRISPGQRAVLVLRYFEDLSVEETAEALGISTGTVKSQTAKGLAAMRGRVPARDGLVRREETA